MKQLLVVLCVGLGLAACGRSEVEGAVLSHELWVRDGALLIENNSDDPVILLSDTPDLCNRLQSNRMAMNEKRLSFEIRNTRYNNGGADFVGSSPRELNVVRSRTSSSNRNNGRNNRDDRDDRRKNNSNNTNSGNPDVVVSFQAYGNNCRETLTDDDKNGGESGRLTLNALELRKDGVARGSFDVVIGEQQDRLNGHFNVAYCDARMNSAYPTCESVAR
ncbi:MAG: hypothetical protein ACT4TC_04935 [Myxococcaceae bacterium]